MAREAQSSANQSCRPNYMLSRNQMTRGLRVPSAPPPIGRIAASSKTTMRMIGIDVDGSFTDPACTDSASGAMAMHNTAITPRDPFVAMMDGMAALCAANGIELSQIDVVLHASTIATKAIREHDASTVGMLTTECFLDIYHTGRYQRPQGYSLRKEIPGAAAWARYGEFELLDVGGASVEGDGQCLWGFYGGLDGYPASLQLISDGVADELPSIMPVRPMKPSDRFLFIGPCAGRDVAMIRRAPEAVRQQRTCSAAC